MKLLQSGRDMLFWLSRKITYPLIGPEVIQIPVTQQCNLRCAICSIRSTNNSLKHALTRSEIQSLLKQARRLGVKEAVFTGGEPFLRADIFDIIHDCAVLGMRSIITTNGTLIDHTVAHECIRSGLSHLHVSLDGLQKSHDHIRGHGTFQRTEQGLKAAIAARCDQDRYMSIGIACVITDANAAELYDLFVYADTLGIDVINYQPLLYNNTNMRDRQRPVLWIQEKHMPLLYDNVQRIYQYTPRHVGLYAEPPLSLLADYYQKPLSQKEWACFSGYKTLFICISDEGKRLVYFCDGVCGDVTESLRACWTSGQARRLRKKAKQCQNVCLQSCYSRVGARDIKTITKGIYGCWCAQ